MAHPKTPLGRPSPTLTTKRYDLYATAAAMDLSITPDGKRFTVCPLCGGERTCQIGEHRFYCHHDDCGARGSGVDLVASLDLDLVEQGPDGRFPRLTREQMPQVTAWMTSNNILKVAVDSPSVAVVKTRTKGRETRAKYKPEVDALWFAAAGLPFDPPCRTWLDTRKLDRKAVTELDLARTLPAEADDSSWARGWLRGHRLMLPVVGATGEMEALRARWVLLKEPKTPSGKRLGKTMPPANWGEGAMSGVVLANPVAVRMLRGELTEPVTLIVVEGEPDFLTWATKRPDLPVVGIWPGAWTPEIAARVPDGSTVVLRTHHDEPGERYAMKVAATLGSRVTLLRSVAKEVA